jgi:elongation factor G
VGKLVYFRVYSGTIKAGEQIYNANIKKKERLARILLMSSNKKEDVEVASCGDIYAAVGLRGTTTGHTLCDVKNPILVETMHFPEPVIWVAIEPKTKADQEKLFESLARLAEEDPTFQVRTNEETDQTIISGMGELHLDILIERLLREFHVKANIGRPQVAYKETIQKKVVHEEKFIRPSSTSKGQYAHVILELEPNPGQGFPFISQLQNEHIIPKMYLPAIQAGAQEAMLGGVIAGYPVIDVKVALIGGSFNITESNDVAFKIATWTAVKNGFALAEPVLLEPYMIVEVVVPEVYLGDVMGSLHARNGKIKGISTRKDAQVVTATVPLKQMFGYATDLRSSTQGRAVYSMQFSHYEKVAQEVMNSLAVSF